MKNNRKTKKCNSNNNFLFTFHISLPYVSEVLLIDIGKGSFFYIGLHLLVAVLEIVGTVRIKISVCAILAKVHNPYNSPSLFEAIKKPGFYLGDKRLPFIDNFLRFLLSGEETSNPQNFGGEYSAKILLSSSSFNINSPLTAFT
jgi:hypothetical protein